MILARAIARKMLAAATLFAAAPNLTMAQAASTVLEPTLIECLSGQAGTDDGFGVLNQIGWEAAERSELSDNAIKAYAARTLALHLSGSEGSPRWASTWQQSLFNAGGERRKGTVEGWPQIRVFQRAGDSSLLEVTTTKVNDQFKVYCKLVASKKLADELSNSFPQPELIPTPIHTFQGRKLLNGILQFSLFDASRIEPLIGDEFPFQAHYNVVPQ